MVSTDCPSGPREILNNGKYGHLVQPGDSIALADAMVSSLKGPDLKVPKSALDRYTVKSAVYRYLESIVC